MTYKWRYSEISSHRKWFEKRFSRLISNYRFCCTWRRNTVEGVRVVNSFALNKSALSERLWLIRKIISCSRPNGALTAAQQMQFSGTQFRRMQTQHRKIRFESSGIGSRVGLRSNHASLSPFSPTSRKPRRHNAVKMICIARDHKELTSLFAFLRVPVRYTVVPANPADEITFFCCRFGWPNVAGLEFRSIRWVRETSDGDFRGGGDDLHNFDGCSLPVMHVL